MEEQSQTIMHIALFNKQNTNYGSDLAGMRTLSLVFPIYCLHTGQKCFLHLNQQQTPTF